MVSMRTLIHLVDDDVPFRTALARLLRTSGFDVEVHHSARDFLRRRHSGNTPACIVLDVQLHGVSGLELQERLGQLGSNLPIIFLTGDGDIPTCVKAIKCGAGIFSPSRCPKALSSTRSIAP